MESSVNANGSTQPADQLREIVAKAEELLVSLGESGDSAVAQLRQRVQTTVQNAKEKLNGLQMQGRNLAGRALTGTDTYVRGNPWIAVGAAAAVGAVIGALVSRRF